VALASADSRAWIVDVEGDAPARILFGPPGIVAGIAWSPDGARLVTAHPEGAWVWDAASGDPIEFLAGHDDFTNATDWSPDGSRIATGSGDGTALIWDPP
jgi:WD40 repeat protein